MTRTLIALVLGVLLGAGATWLLARSALAPPELGAWPTARPAPLPSTNVVAPAAVRETGRDFYRRLADADATELAAMIAQAAAQAPSTDRELALAVLLKRYAELDIVRAVRLARELRVGAAGLGAVYGAWARAAPEQVLAALSTVDSPDDAADVALALIMALGGDAAAVERVAAVLASREGEMPLGPVVSPFGPGITPGQVALAPPRSALALTAQRWADLDPRRALAATREIADERVRLAFEAAALRALTRVAPKEVFAHLASSDASARREFGALAGSLVELARADPEQLLNAARDLPPDVRRIAESAALQQLAERDPLAAFRHVERMPAGAEREGLLQVVARAYGRRDAAAALAWAQAMPGQPMLVGAVIAGVAERDVDGAFDLALGLGSPRGPQALQMVAMAGARQDSTAEATANRLLTLDDPALRESLASMVVSTWAQRSPDNAMRWLLANAASASPNAFQQMGLQLARRDPQNALAYSAEVPPAAREQWVQGVGQAYAQADPRGAIDWLGQYRGEQWYGRAASTVAMAVAQRDGAAAARLVDEIDMADLGPQERRLVNVVATNWANQDATAAADWSVGRPTDVERQAAVQSVVAVWSNRDVDGARQWTLRLPQGALRDVALAPLLTATATQGGGGPDASLLNAFSSDRTRQAAVLQVVQGLAYSDAARARTVADAHLGDPNLRAQAERVIEAARNGPRRPVGIGVTQSALPIERVR